MSIPTTSTAERRSAQEEVRRRRGPFLRVVTNPLFPLVFQAAGLGVFVFLILAGWGRHGIAGVKVEGPLIYTNLATLGFWVAWLMGLIVLLPLVGRLWCTVCPVGGCNDLLARVGAKKAYPRKLQNFGVMAILLFGFTAGADLLRINRYPDYTAWFLLLVLGLAAAAGLVFKGRVFCRYLCPVGGMAGLFTRLAPVEIGSRDPAVCRRCETKACYLGESRWYRLSWSGWHSLFRMRRPGCPASIFPPEAADNANCLMCAQCLKNCPWDNLRWGTRRPGKGLWGESVRDRSEALLVIILAGIVVSRFSRFWPPLRGVLEWPAAALAASAPSLPQTVLQGTGLLFTFVLWPLLFFLLLSLAAKLSAEVSLTSWPAGSGDGGEALLYDLAEIDEQRRSEEEGWAARRHTLWGYCAAFGHAFIPLLAGSYAAFALVKLNEKIGYLPLALGDQGGVRTWLSVNELQILPAPEGLLSLALIRWVAVALAGAGLVLSVWSAGRIGKAVYGPASPAARRGSLVVRLGLLFAGSLVLWCIRVWLFR